MLRTKSISADFGEPELINEKTIYRVDDDDGKHLVGYHKTSYSNYYTAREMAYKFQHHTVEITTVALRGFIPAVRGDHNSWLYPKVVVDGMTKLQIDDIVRQAYAGGTGPYDNNE